MYIIPIGAVHYQLIIIIIIIATASQEILAVGGDKDPLSVKNVLITRDRYITCCYKEQANTAILALGVGSTNKSLTT